MGLIQEAVIQQVLDRTEISSVIGEHVHLKRSGRSLKGVCPFHDEKTPSFIVNEDKQIFHCFGCGVGGNVISFVMKVDRLDFREAVRVLGEKCGVIIEQDTNAQVYNESQKLFGVMEDAKNFFHRILLSDKTDDARQARDYLKRRNISLETVKKFQLGFALNRWDALKNFFFKRGIKDKDLLSCGLIVPRQNQNGYYDRFRNRVIFPIFDIRSRVIGFGGRAMDDTPAKYLNSPESVLYSKSRQLFNLSYAKDAIIREDNVVVVEGYMDCVTPVQNGVEHVVAALGTALTLEQIKLIRRFTSNVTLLFDADAAGQSAMLRSIDSLMSEDMSVTVATLDEGEDPDSFIKNRGVDAFQNRLKSAPSFFDFKLSILTMKHDLQSISGQADIVKGMLPTLDKIKNSVMLGGYIQKLADRLLIEGRLIQEELRLYRKQDRIGPQEKVLVKDKTYKEEIRPVEKTILKILLQYPHYIKNVQQKLNADAFHHPLARKLLQNIFQMPEKDVDAKKVMNAFEDPDIHQTIAELISSEGSIEKNDSERILMDCISRLNQESLKKKRQALTVEIKQAEQNGDDAELKRLQLEFIRLMQ